MPDLSSPDLDARPPRLVDGLGPTVERHWRTILAGVLWVASLLFLWAAFEIEPPSRPVPVPPALFPRIVSVGLAVSATAIVVQKFREARRAATTRADEPVEEVDNPLAIAAEGDEESASAPLDLVYIMVLYGLYLLVLTPVGFHLATFGFVFAAIAYFDRSRVLRALLIAVIATLVIGVVFIEVLRISLPSGLWRVELLDLAMGMVA